MSEALLRHSKERQAKKPGTLPQLLSLAFWIAMTGIGLAAIGMSTLYLRELGSPPLIIHEAEILTPTVRRGDNVLLRLSWEKLRDCPAYVLITIRDADGQLHFFEQHGGWSPLGANAGTFAVGVPENAALGKAIYWRTIEYNCSPLHTSRVRTPETTFLIEP